MEYSDYNQMKQMQQMEAMKKQLLGKMLSKEAYERLGRVRFANPELAAQAEMYLLQVYQTGRLGMVSDAQMKEILKLLTSGRRDFSIKRQNV
ncbi:MAG: DNA-binding protein [Candidatus Aenigmatarchaeota archaeon]